MKLIRIAFLLGLLALLAFAPQAREPFAPQIVTLDVTAPDGQHFKFKAIVGDQPIRLVDGDTDNVITGDDGADKVTLLNGRQWLVYVKGIETR